MSDETEEYIESVSIPTLVWIGEPGAGRREMASAFVKARFPRWLSMELLRRNRNGIRSFRTETAPNPAEGAP